MFEFEIFIFPLISPDTFPASSVVVRKVTSLTHEPCPRVGRGQIKSNTVRFQSEVGIAEEVSNEQFPTAETLLW